MLKNIAIAGIFDRFHAGHKHSIKLAFEKGEIVHLILVNAGDQYTHPNKLIEMVEPYEERKKKVMDFIKELGVEDRLRFYGAPDALGIAPIFGWTALRDNDELGWIQCKTDETQYEELANTIDYIRVHAYRKAALVWFWVDPVLDEEGNKVSSSVFRRRELLNAHKKD
jgi:cytidyltransferase-like protein